MQFYLLPHHEPFFWRRGLRQREALYPGAEYQGNCPAEVWVLDMKRENTAHRIRIPEEGLLLQPGKLYLGRTAEYTRTEGYVPMLEGCSSVGRLGFSSM